MPKEYKDLTLEQIDKALREPYYGQKEAEERRINITCLSQRCVDAFYDAMRAEAKRLGITLKED